MSFPVELQKILEDLISIEIEQIIEKTLLSDEQLSSFDECICFPEAEGEFLPPFFKKKT